MVAVSKAKQNTFGHCMADLLFIDILFSLRSCEYTKTNSHRRMTQFRFRDMQFHDGNGVIPPDADAYVFLAALAITLFLDTQNNCLHGESSTMDSTCPLRGDPIPACAWRYLHLRNNNVLPNTPYYDYYVLVDAAPKSVTVSNTVELLRAAAKRFDFQRIGFFPYRLVPIPYGWEVP